MAATITLLPLLLLLTAAFFTERYELTRLVRFLTQFVSVYFSGLHGARFLSHDDTLFCLAVRRAQCSSQLLAVVGVVLQW